MENVTGLRQPTSKGARLRRAAWTDQKYPAQGINPPGTVDDPVRDSTDGMLLFEAGATNVIAGGALMDHARRIGSVIEPHIHWCATSTGSGNIVWRFEYSIAAMGAVFPAWTVIDVTAAASGTSALHQLTTFGDIALPGDALATMVKWRVSRMGALAGDTYGGDAKLLEFDIHIQLDGFGSEEKYSKR